MAKKYFQTGTIQNLAIFTILINQFYETNFAWQALNIIIFATGTTTLFNIIKNKQLKENLEFAGIAFAATLIGLTNAIGIQLPIIQSINNMGIFIAVFVGAIEFITLFQFYDTKKEKTEIKSLKAIKDEPKHFLRREENAI